MFRPRPKTNNLRHELPGRAREQHLSPPHRGAGREVSPARAAVWGAGTPVSAPNIPAVLARSWVEPTMAVLWLMGTSGSSMLSSAGERYSV